MHTFFKIQLTVIILLQMKNIKRKISSEVV